MKKAIRLTAILLLISLQTAIGQLCNPLSFDCPVDITLTAGPGDCGVPYNYTVPILGDCALISSGQIDNSGLVSGDIFPIGVSEQTWVLEDETGVTDTCTFEVTVLEYPEFITDQACNGQIFVGVDQDCEVLITADMVLEGGNYGCYDSFSVMIKTLSGAIVPNPVTGAFVNQQLEVSIIDRFGNNCWGYVTVEDKTVPALMCGTYEVPCQSSTLPHVDPSQGVAFPVPSTAIVQPSTGVGPFTVEGFDQCGPATLTYVDHVMDLDCSNQPYSRRIERTWTLVDLHGNTTSCMDILQVVPLSLSDVQFPNRDGTDAPSISCDGDWDANGDGIPQPEEIGDFATQLCGAWATYVDHVHHTGCGTLIHRDWNILHKCSGTNLNYTQVIRLEDDVPPVIQCPSVLEGSTNADGCRSYYRVPAPPVLVDGCSDVTYQVEVIGETVRNAGSADHPSYIVQDLDLGTYTLIYRAVDACGQMASCTTQLVIEDRTPPRIVCDHTVQAYVMANQSEVHVDRLYILAEDECGVDSVRLRRRVMGVCAESSADDLTWHELETFCCEEIGQHVTIEVGVWDIYGNMTICLTSVFVSGELPILSCPPDISVSCAYPLDLDDLSAFGTIRLDESEVQDIIIDDPDYRSGCKMEDGKGPMKWGRDPAYEVDCPIMVSDSVVDLRTCGQSPVVNGEPTPGVIRYFIFTYAGEEIGRCSQSIFVLNCGGDSEIDWPGDTFSFYCNPPVDSLFGGRPMLSGGGCGAYAFEFTDAEVPTSGDTCSRMLRTWVATDTCGSGSMTTLTHVQSFFVLYDNDLSISCEDTLMIDPSTPCDPATDGACVRMVMIDAPSLVSCDSQQAYRYEIDFEADASTIFEIDLAGDGEVIQQVLPVGWHAVRWLVQDGCQGRDTCVTMLFVPPCGTPDVICQDVMITLSDTNGVYVSVTASIDTLFNTCGAEITGYVVCDSADLAGLDSVRLLNGVLIDVATALEALAVGDTCFLADSLLIDCEDVTGTSNTLFYEVVLIQGMDTSVCEARIIVEDTANICESEPCEFVYAISPNGAFFSINTQTGEITLLLNTGVTTGTNAVAVNSDLGLAYFATERTVYWIDLITGDVDIVGTLPSITGSLTNAAGSYWRGHYYCGPELGGTVVEDLYRIELSGDGKSFAGVEQNLTNGTVPLGNFGDFIVLDGMIGQERLILSLYNNFDANDIIEYDVATNAFNTLFSISSSTSSQITIDNLDRIWYFDNASLDIGILDLTTGLISNESNVGFSFSDLGRSYCPPDNQSLTSSTPELSHPTSSLEMRAIPNPFIGRTALEVNWDRSEPGQLQLYGADGRLIEARDVDLSAGVQQFELTTAYRGLMIAQLITRSRSVQCRMISEE